jgi:hypothetical protein
MKFTTPFLNILTKWLILHIIPGEHRFGCWCPGCGNVSAWKDGSLHWWSSDDEGYETRHKKYEKNLSGNMVSRLAWFWKFSLSSSCVPCKLGASFIKLCSMYVGASHISKEYYALYYTNMMMIAIICPSLALFLWIEDVRGISIGHEKLKTHWHHYFLHHISSLLLQ